MSSEEQAQEAGRLLIERNVKRQELACLTSKRDRFLNQSEIIPKMLWGDGRIEKKGGNKLVVEGVGEIEWLSADEIVEIVSGIRKLGIEVQQMSATLDQMGA